MLTGAQTVAVRGLHDESLGTVIGVDRERHVALIRTSHDVGPGEPLVFADEEPAQGVEIVAIACPEGRPHTPTVGTVSRSGRSLDIDDRRLHDLVQFDADTSPNSNGGPLLDAHGAVIGLTEGQDDIGAVRPCSRGTPCWLAWRSTAMVLTNVNLPRAPARRACQAAQGVESLSASAL